MKQFLSLAVCLLLVTAKPAEAQIPITPTKSTLTNADTSYLTFKMVPTFDHMSVQAIVTKTSGTVAGVILPQYSNDGINYISGNDSLIVGNTPINTKIWLYTGNSYLYYRYRYVTSGTQVSTLKGYYISRSRQ